MGGLLNVFIYVISGNSKTGVKTATIESHSTILFNEGDQVQFSGLRLLLLLGESLNEPIS